MPSGEDDTKTTKTNLIHTLGRVVKQLSCNEGMLIFYYIGHGRQNYLNLDGFGDEVSGEEIQTALRGLTVDNLLVVLDCCNAQGVQTIDMNLAAMKTDSRVKTLLQWSCCRSDQIAVGCSFTRFVLQGLRGANRCDHKLRNMSQSADKRCERFCSACRDLRKHAKVENIVGLTKLQEFVGKKLRSLNDKGYDMAPVIHGQMTHDIKLGYFSPRRVCYTVWYEQSNLPLLLDYISTGLSAFRKKIYTLISGNLIVNNDY